MLSTTASAAVIDTAATLAGLFFLLLFAIVPLSVRHRIDRNQRPQQFVGRHSPEGPFEDRLDLAGPEQPRQRSIDHQAKRTVIARQRERIGFIAEILLAD